MTTHDIYVTEETTNAEGIRTQRVTLVTYKEDVETGVWGWVRPDERLTPEAITEWDRVMDILSNVNGEDFRHIVCGAGLMDHCLENQEIRNYESSSE